MTSLTLCVIARDEERFLPDCLDSVRGAVDEIVVVDTGSGDQTRAVAAAKGARVVEFAWCDDFSAARNAALDAARGTHVLVLDADERLADPAKSLRRAASNSKFTIGLLAVHDAARLDAKSADVLSGQARLWEPCFVPRFFVRDPALRFTRRVHETITGDALHLARFLETRGSALEPLDAAIVHLGEVPALRAERKKRARNTRLLERALADDPADGDLAGYLALELMRGGDAKAARALGEKHLGPFLEHLRRLPAQVAKPSPVQLASVLATCLVQDGECERALDVLRASKECCIEPHPNLLYLEGAALERLGRAADARRAFESCIALHGKRFTIPVNPGATNFAPRLRLANLDLISRVPRAALSRLGHAATWTGSFELSAALLRAEAHLQLGEAAAALEALTPVLGRSEAPPDLFALAALAVEGMGTPEPAFRDAARRFERRQWLEVRRMALLAGA